MATRADQTILDPYERLEKRIRDLERAIREERAARRLESASIGAGGIRVKDGGSISLDGGGAVEVTGGRVVVYDEDGALLALLGDLGGGSQGVWLGRAGGKVAFATYGQGGPDAAFAGLYDMSGNYVVTDDTFSKRGLGRPYIPLQVAEVTVPTATTTNSSFETILSGANPIQHPVMYADLLVRASDASTAGEIRLTIDGAQVGPTLTVPAGQYAFAHIGPFKVGPVNEPSYGALHAVAVQARRTAGSGTVGARVLSLLGLESAFVS